MCYKEMFIFLLILDLFTFRCKVLTELLNCIDRFSSVLISIFLCFPPGFLLLSILFLLLLQLFSLSCCGIVSVFLFSTCWYVFLRVFVSPTLLSFWIYISCYLGFLDCILQLWDFKFSLKILYVIFIFKYVKPTIRSSILVK